MALNIKRVMVTTLFALALLTVAFAPFSGQQAGTYDPWLDYNDDGVIDVLDLQALAEVYGTSGTPLSMPASLEYDSGWINITDKQGQYFNITHNLNSTDIIVDITGKTTVDGGVHQRHLGGTGVVYGTAYGGILDDCALSVVQTSDGGYALAGYTHSYIPYELPDFYLVKTDSSGNMQWNKTYRLANRYSRAYSVVQTSDGGYALAGCSYEIGATYAGDYWLVKTDSDGNKQWGNLWGAPDEIDCAYSVVQTSDGGYAIAGETYWDKWWTPPDWNWDMWLIKTDSNGSTQWTEIYGEDYVDEHAYSVVQTSDVGYAIAGEWFGNMWLVKTDSSGNMQWNKTYESVPRGESVVQTSDGGYAIAGVGGRLVKTDSSGNELWNKNYGGTQADCAYSVVQTSDGGYALAGYTESFGFGLKDFWLVKTDSSGNMQWNKTYGGEAIDSGQSVVQTSDGGYALAGYTESFGVGRNDFFLVRTDSEGNTQEIFKEGLAWTDSTANSITLHRGTIDPHWNYVRVRILVAKQNP